MEDKVIYLDEESLRGVAARRRAKFQDTPGGASVVWLGGSGGN